MSEMTFRDVRTQQVGSVFSREELSPGTRVKFLVDILGLPTTGRLGTIVQELPNSFVEVSIDGMNSRSYATSMPWKDFQVEVKDEA